MEQLHNDLQEERKDETPLEEKPSKSLWQATKESWYDKIPLTLKQLDIIIGVCLTLLAITFVLIFLDAAGVF